MLAACLSQVKRRCHVPQARPPVCAAVQAPSGPKTSSMPDINGSYERLAMPTRVSWKGREWYDGFHGDSAGSCLSAFGPLLPPANGLGGRKAIVLRPLPRNPFPAHCGRSGSDPVRDLRTMGCWGCPKLHHGPG